MIDSRQTSRFFFKQKTAYEMTSSLVGSTKGTRAVRWGVAKNIVMGWFITMPAAALVAAGAYWIVELAFG